MLIHHLTLNIPMKTTVFIFFITLNFIIAAIPSFAANDSSTSSNVSAPPQSWIADEDRADAGVPSFENRGGLDNGSAEDGVDTDLLVSAQ